MEYTYTNASINSSPTITGRAGSKLTGASCVAVKYDADGDIVLAGAGEMALGVTLPMADALEDGDAVTVLVTDIGLWTAGGAIARGDALASDANGKAVKATAGAFILGVALSEASKAGKTVRAQLIKAGYASAAAGGGA